MNIYVCLCVVLLSQLVFGIHAPMASREWEAAKKLFVDSASNFTVSPPLQILI